jgi:hypothetical protein
LIADDDKRSRRILFIRYRGGEKACSVCSHWQPRRPLHGRHCFKPRVESMARRRSNFQDLVINDYRESSTN